MEKQKTIEAIIDYYQESGVLVNIRDVMLAGSEDTKAEVQQVIVNRIEHIDALA